ncbi:hypothetical protein HB364_16265 [Pseudoflavitalea sp. X16]|uniref:hypothetical protein n=1 Tax=Paraflavitalea devenefica TaxID=2716334 RepID=UPI00141EB42F|nr:hypothetical protein [Paraflavitalea devenefica]NII26645.1 hypothetical protein [Paraflavitalea devenefica]
MAKEIIKATHWTNPAKRAPKKLISKKKNVHTNLDEAVDFVNKYKKGSTKAKTINQLLDEL